MSFNPAKKSYGEGFGRYLICQVINRKDDPEQSGRLKVRVIGYQDDLNEEDLPWARVQQGPNNPMDGGVGGPITGATEGTYMLGFFADGLNQIMLTGSIGKAGEEDENGNLDQTGRKSDVSPHARDKDKGGGDLSFDFEGKVFRDKSITEYAKNESPNPYGREASKDGNEETSESFSIGMLQYA